MGLGLLSGADWGKVGGKVTGAEGDEGAMALARPHPRPFQDKRPYSQDMGSPQRRRRIKRRFGRLAVQRRSLTHRGLARRRALHPPRRLIPNLTTGAMRDCLASPQSPAALFGAIRGFTLLPPSPLSLVRPCNYRRIGRASHTSSPATPCIGALGPTATWWENMSALPQGTGRAAV